MSSDLNQKSKLAKIKDDPIPAIGKLKINLKKKHLKLTNWNLIEGVAGFVGVVSLAVINYFRRGSSMKPSVYVIQTRVAAQSLVIGLLTGSAAYHMFQKWTEKSPVEHENALNVSRFHPGEDHSGHNPKAHVQQHDNKHK